MAEIFEYAEILENGALKKTPLERLACIAVFVMSGCSNTQRFKKPFNPLLGETFEYVDETRGIKLFAEQISHHPPISASHTEHKYYSLWQQAHITTKFLGNSFELYTNGMAYLYLKQTGELFKFSPPVNKVHNIILGSMWIEYYGPSVVENLTTGDKCVLEYDRAGWFGRYSYKAKGYCTTPNGLKPIKIEGTWNESCSADWVSKSEHDDYLRYLQTAEGKERKELPIDLLPLSVKNNYEEFKNNPKSLIIDSAEDVVEQPVVFWAVPPHNFECPFDMTEYAYHLCDLTHEESYYCPTDSRLRPDLRTLASQIMDRAIYYKSFVEEEQRKDRRVLEEREGKDAKWNPVWFSKVAENIYVYTGNYWEQAAIRRGEVEATPEERAKALEVEQTKGLAMYFPRYKFSENPNNLTPEQREKLASQNEKKEDN